MHKKSFMKATALLVCLVFLSLSAPGLFAVEKKAPKSKLSILIEKPAAAMSSFFTFVCSIFNLENKADSSQDSQNKNDSNPIPKPTGDLDSDRISEGD